MKTTFLESFTWKKGCLGIFLLIVLVHVLFCIIALVVRVYDYRKAVDLAEECHVACKQNDYEKAHNLLLQLKETTYKYEETKEYVFKQEALYLMSLEDEAAKKRIVYLLKEEGNNSNHVSMLIDLAIENDDEDFVKTLTKQYKDSISSDMLRKIVDFLYIEKDDGCSDFVQSLLNRYGQSGLLLEAAVEKGDESLVISLAQYVSLSDNNIISKLASAKNNKYDEIIIGLIIAKESDITKKPQKGFVTFYGTGYSTSEFEDMCNDYSNSVKKFNGICQNILGIAINNKNQHLAQRVVSIFKSDIHVDEIGFVDKVHYRYKITIDNNVVNEAKATYYEAVKSGAFK